MTLNALGVFRVMMLMYASREILDIGDANDIIEIIADDWNTGVARSQR